MRRGTAGGAPSAAPPRRRPGPPLGGARGGGGEDVEEEQIAETGAEPREEEDEEKGREMLSLKIKLPSDTEQHVVRCPADADVRELKDIVMLELKLADRVPPRCVRLISAGKMLAPDDALLQQFGVKHDSFVHCVVSKNFLRGGGGGGGSEVSAMGSLNQSSDGVAAAAAAAAAAGAATTAAGNVDPSRLRGLDRLMVTREMSVDEVAAVRSYFRGQIERFRTDVPQDEGEDDEEYRGRTETMWMNAQRPDSEFAMNVMPHAGMMGGGTGDEGGLLDPGPLSGMEEVGSVGDFIWGFAIGFLLGFVGLLWVWDRGMNFRHRMGITTGVCCQLMWGVAYNQMNRREQGAEP